CARDKYDYDWNFDVW
nr:immunoglobulin heavy chain junction region [Mus musculus]